jgi:hypothetical protein
LGDSNYSGLTQPKTKKTTKKGNMSEEKKDKPQVEVRDLKPNKDAKGGVGTGLPKKKLT